MTTPILWDHTQWQALTSCEQFWFDRHHRGLNSTGESRAAFFGQAAHHGVKVFYETEDAGAAASATLEYCNKAAPVFGDENPAKPDHRTVGSAQAIVRLYAARWPKATRDFDMVLNEQYLEDTNTGECCIVDRVVRRHVDGLLYTRELKTSSQGVTPAYLRSWQHHQQVAFQLDLAEKALGESIEGFWLDHVFVARRKDGPTMEDINHYGPWTYSKAKRATMRGQRLRWAEVRDDLASGRREPLQTTKSCVSWGSACIFLPHCSADTPAEREDMIQRDLATGALIVKPWNPKERDAE